MLKPTKKKQSPIYLFRLSQEDKEWLEGTLENLYERINRKAKPDEKNVTKSMILIEALRIGFDKIRKDLK